MNIYSSGWRCLFALSALCGELSDLRQLVSARPRFEVCGWSSAVQSVSYKRHRYPPEVISYAVWLYFHFTPSLRDVEELLAQRGTEVSYETIRCWTLKFGPLSVRNYPTRTWSGQ